MKRTQPGEMVQIDHMSVYLNSKGIKHFKAICPKTRFMVAHAYSRATSINAANFLALVLAKMPFKVKSIQVDGGSEFMKDFEDACAELKIDLYVLPPKSPKYNGNVERANGITRDEFYSQYTGLFNTKDLNVSLEQYQAMYNGYRPHQSLNYQTPMEYIQSLDNLEAA